MYIFGWTRLIDVDLMSNQWSNQPTDQLTNTQIDQLTNWPTGILTLQHIDTPTEPINWPTNLPHDQASDKLTEQMTSMPTNPSTDGPTSDILLTE